MTTATASFRVASFNVNGGYDTPGGPWRLRLAQVVTTMRNSRADLFLLQEAHEEHDEHKQIVAELKRQSGSSRWVLMTGDGGNHVIADGSRFKSISKHVYRLPYRRHYVEHNLWHAPTGVRWWTWNTHMIASDPDKGRTVEEARAMRAEQSEAVVDHVERLHRSLGGGDFNADTDGLRPTLAAVGHDDVRDRVTDVFNQGYDSRDGYGVNKMRGLWIDHLAVGDLTTVTAAGLIDSGTASDHNLVYASVSITGPVTTL